MHRRRRSWRDSVFAAVVIGVLSGKAVAASWSYQDITDEMSGEKGKQASVTSTNKLSFKFPYQGAQRAKLVIRDHPVHGKDAIVMIDRGQMLCGINECELRVRFDDG
ncbi:MAG: hypothetical protein KDI51_13950, partial [Xanthomonadales bacterium]|nr:hypothetical protein [Xanthomonadales bacterium]